jgi:hypothetical protein
VKRAEAEVVGATAFELYKGTHHIYNIQLALYLLYGTWRDHEGPAIYGYGVKMSARLKQFPGHVAGYSPFFMPTCQNLTLVWSVRIVSSGIGWYRTENLKLPAWAANKLDTF